MTGNVEAISVPISVLAARVAAIIPISMTLTFDDTTGLLTATLSNGSVSSVMISGVGPAAGRTTDGAGNVLSDGLGNRLSF